MNETLLVELGTEELPPTALAGLVAAFAGGIEAGLDEAGLGHGPVTPLASPRRLAVSIAGVAGRAPDQTIDRLGPAVTAAFDDQGEPTRAAEGFARSCGVAVKELEQRDTDKGPRLAFTGSQAGQTLGELLPEVVAESLRRLPIPKRMRWADRDDSFVRPVHWLVALHGSEVLPLSLFGIDAGRATRGHRFHHPDTITLDHADEYAAKLAAPGRVLVGMDARRTQVHEQVIAAARTLGGKALIEEALLDEVCALVEWPCAVAGRFDDRYLVLPREVLVATMQSHQRYFPVADGDGTLLPGFVTVANIDSVDPARVVAGNERVIRPRLADALFFWEQDLARGLDHYAAGLDRVTFQRELGSMADKVARVGAIADGLASQLGVPSAAVARACALAKADLLSDMVGEFPELQGIMGGYYARHTGEDPAVAEALPEQYAPRQAGAPIAVTPVGRMLALADKLDSLAGVFATGQRPSGVKDPFGLRRAALGVLRTVIEGELDLDLPGVLTDAVARQPVDCDRQAVTNDLLVFHGERLRAYYIDQAVDPSVFDSVAALGLSRPLDFDQRIRAVQGFVHADAAVALCGAHKRIRNILKNETPAGRINAALIDEPAENDLAGALDALRDDIAERASSGDYAGALARLAELQTPVDRFFDEVLVMSDDAAVRDNRLALLGALDGLCRSVADISRLTPTEAAA
ncbi:glycine--tRNA ligase subunit beta [Spectribacter hydrogenoxidans]|uniref:Glycine--tRNA ligase beta subunit n=1 Tax=Spectribacter hydrogenoxidans TaxID=3075608 RepID=A0ABU3BWB8_9GAMM|nr:glycine--tRNA ligase subunit beta [Salinisphaera sp. W335]MDT0633585.1 glycine--tRNA ligase subunit beta [Salinisphaera sp. W335]